jgi:hypothetical protein
MTRSLMHRIQRLQRAMPVPKPLAPEPEMNFRRLSKDQVMWLIAMRDRMFANGQGRPNIDVLARGEQKELKRLCALARAKPAGECRSES